MLAGLDVPIGPANSGPESDSVRPRSALEFIRMGLDQHLWQSHRGYPLTSPLRDPENSKV